jgi:hypothetical protein
VQLEEKLTVTWKVHCVTAHLAPFLAKHGRGMADICEQVGEAAHYAMAPVLQRHKVAEDNPKHGERQLTAVVKFASWNVFNMSGTKKTKKVVKKE